MQDVAQLTGQSDEADWEQLHSAWAKMTRLSEARGGDPAALRGLEEEFRAALAVIERLSGWGGLSPKLAERLTSLFQRRYG